MNTAFTYGNLSTSEKKVPAKSNELDKLKIETLKEEMKSKLKKNPDLAQKAAQIIIDMLEKKQKK